MRLLFDLLLLLPGSAPSPRYWPHDEAHRFLFFLPPTCGTCLFFLGPGKHNFIHDWSLFSCGRRFNLIIPLYMFFFNWSINIKDVCCGIDRPPMCLYFKVKSVFLLNSYVCWISFLLNPHVCWIRMFAFHTAEGLSFLWISIFEKKLACQFDFLVDCFGGQSTASFLAYQEQCRVYGLVDLRSACLVSRAWNVSDKIQSEMSLI